MTEDQKTDSGEVSFHPFQVQHHLEKNFSGTTSSTDLYAAAAAAVAATIPPPPPPPPPPPLCSFTHSPTPSGAQYFLRS
jgi:hypothetical protein